MLGWRLSLLLAAVTLHGCLSAETEVQDEKSTSLRDIVQLYNEREEVTYLYKALDQLPTAPLQEDENPKRRICIMRETECLKSANPDLSQCDFKPDGDVKICSVDLGDEDPEDIVCTSLTKDVRVKRSSRKPCRGRNCRPRLSGGYTLIGRPAKTNNKPRVIWV
ncbi:cathelicidin-2-like [Hyla sarda]|uniref:cathelicidin-2-like n=1 Tax=Hyla sarda TaxID=327740 RepID=UPI0024C24ED3|nr:cathelicidin-2-like [Hyla sarda]